MTAPTKHRRRAARVHKTGAMDADHLLLQVVHAVVNGFADAMADKDGKDVIDLTAHFYRVLAINCQGRADLAAALAPAVAKKRSVKGGDA